MSLPLKAHESLPNLRPPPVFGDKEPRHALIAISGYASTLLKKLNELQLAGEIPGDVRDLQQGMEAARRLVSEAPFLDANDVAAQCKPNETEFAMNTAWHHNLVVFSLRIWQEENVKSALNCFFGTILPAYVPYKKQVFDVYLDIVTRDLLTRVFDLCETEEEGDEVEVFPLIEEAFPEKLDAYGVDTSRENADMLLELALARRNKILAYDTLEEWERDTPHTHVCEAWQRMLQDIVEHMETDMRDYFSSLTDDAAARLESQSSPEGRIDLRTAGEEGPAEKPSRERFEDLDDDDPIKEMWRRRSQTKSVNDIFNQSSDERPQSPPEARVTEEDPYEETPAGGSSLQVSQTPVQSTGAQHTSEESSPEQTHNLSQDDISRGSPEASPEATPAERVSDDSLHQGPNPLLEVSQSILAHDSPEFADDFFQRTSTDNFEEASWYQTAPISQQRSPSPSADNGSEASEALSYQSPQNEAQPDVVEGANQDTYQHVQSSVSRSPSVFAVEIPEAPSVCEGDGQEDYQMEEEEYQLDFDEEEEIGGSAVSVGQSRSIQRERRDLQAVGGRALSSSFSSLGKRQMRQESPDGAGPEAGGDNAAETSSAAKRRRKFAFWTSEETVALEEGLSRFGPSWVKIKKAYPEALRNRSNVQIKDKARTEYNYRLQSGLPLEMYECLRKEPDDECPAKERRTRRRRRT